MTKQNYIDFAEQLQPKSHILINSLKAFIIGGLICVLGEIIINIYKNFNMSTDNASAAASLTLIAISAIITGLGLYDQIARHAGAGTLVPITGFANSVVSAALEFKSEGLITGMCTKMFSIAGPVIVFGTVSSVIYGILLYIFL